MSQKELLLYDVLKGIPSLCFVLVDDKGDDKLQDFFYNPLRQYKFLS